MKCQMCGESLMVAVSDEENASSDIIPTESTKGKSLLKLLSTLSPSDEDFPNIDIGHSTLDDVDL